MTTIFADAKTGVMVCDSKCSSGGNWYPMTKVHRIGDELVGLAGSVKDGKTWLKWYRSGKRGPRPKVEEFQAIALRKDGVYELCADGLEQLIERGFHAVGSGGPCAVAAFMAGADPRESVNIAIQIDMGSGGEIFVHALTP